MAKERRGSILYKVCIVVAAAVLLLIILLPRFKTRYIPPEARRAEAERYLTQIYDQQMEYRLIHYRYAVALDSLSFRSPVESLFSYEIVAADDTSFFARARAHTDFDKDAQLETWTINQNKEFVQKTPD